MLKEKLICSIPENSSKKLWTHFRHRRSPSDRRSGLLALGASSSLGTPSSCQECTSCGKSSYAFRGYSVELTSRGLLRRHPYLRLFASQQSRKPVNCGRIEEKTPCESKNPRTGLVHRTNLFTSLIATSNSSSILWADKKNLHTSSLRNLSERRRVRTPKPVQFLKLRTMFEFPGVPKL